MAWLVLWDGYPPVIKGFTPERANNAGRVAKSWRHKAICILGKIYRLFYSLNIDIHIISNEKKRKQILPLWTGQFLNSKFDSMKSKMSIKYTCLTLQSLTHREYVVYTNYMNMYISTRVISIQRHLFWKLCYFPFMQIARLKDWGVWPCHLYGHKSATLPNASMLIGTHTHIYIWEKISQLVQMMANRIFGTYPLFEQLFIVIDKLCGGWIKLQNFPYDKFDLKRSSAIYRQFCFGLNVLLPRNLNLSKYSYWGIVKLPNYQRPKGSFHMGAVLLTWCLGLIFIAAWNSNYNHYKMWDKLLIRFQT